MYSQRQPTAQTERNSYPLLLKNVVTVYGITNGHYIVFLPLLLRTKDEDEDVCERRLKSCEFRLSFETTE